MRIRACARAFSISEYLWFVAQTTASMIIHNVHRCNGAIYITLCNKIVDEMILPVFIARHKRTFFFISLVCKKHVCRRFHWLQLISSGNYLNLHISSTASVEGIFIKNGFLFLFFIFQFISSFMWSLAFKMQRIDFKLIFNEQKKTRFNRNSESGLNLVWFL